MISVLLNQRVSVLQRDGCKEFPSETDGLIGITATKWSIVARNQTESSSFDSMARWKKSEV